MKINQIKPWIDSSEANYIKKVVRKTFLTEGKETEKFENFFVKKFKVKHAISVSNWSCGIFACLKALNIGKNDEVIVPNLTFIATLNSVILSGATPILCDVNEQNLSIDLNKIEKKITKKTKAIIPVHLYGHCCELSKLLKICKKNKIYMIEDAAQAIYSTYKKKKLGTLGIFGGFSFYGNKIITTGEGGIVFTNNSKLRDKIYEIKNHGRLKKGVFVHKEIGYNFMFTEMQAAIGNIQVKKLKKIINRKEKIFKIYKKELSDIKSISFMKNISNNKPVHWFTNIFTKDKARLKIFLSKNNIQTRDIFLPLNLQPCYRGKNIVKNLNEKFPISNKIYKNGLSLPSSYDLKSSELKFIIKKIRKFYLSNL